jgi:hypothetical protein
MGAGCADQSRASQVILEQASYAACREPSSVTIQEQGRFADSFRSTMRQVHANRLHSNMPHRAEPFSPALSAHSYELLLEIDVIKIDADSFADP